MRRSRKVRALGSRHSFNDLADTSEDLISMENLNEVISVADQRQTVTVQGRITYSALSQFLQAKDSPCTISHRCPTSQW